MKTSLKLLSLLALTAALATQSGCRAESKKLEAPVMTYSGAETSAAMQTIDVTPRVDMVIVVDYSTSMARHQANLAANIDQFVNEFRKHTLIDFQVGVLPMYDHVHCLDSQHPPTIQNGYQVGTCYPFGQLLPLKGENGDLPGSRFVTKSTPDFMNVLKRTILVGEKPGPAYEEMFSPLIPALTHPSLTSGPNQGFYRGKFLIVIFITDGDDSDNPGSSITAEQMERGLVDLSNGDRTQLSTVGVLSLSSDKSCAKDQSAPQGPRKIEELVKRTNGKLLSLCAANFGKQLGQIGKDLSVRVARQKIDLSGEPDFAPEREFEVYHGKTKLKRASGTNTDDGWIYNPERRTIEIGSQTEFKEEGEAKISIKFTPVSLQNAANGKVN